MSAINADIADLGPELDIDLLGIKDFTIEALEKFDLDDIQDDKPKQKHILEVQCANEAELMSTYEDLLARGLIVRYK
jgi:hypothetical protein